MKGAYLETAQFELIKSLLFSQILMSHDVGTPERRQLVCFLYTLQNDSFFCVFLWSSARYRSLSLSCSKRQSLLEKQTQFERNQI